MRIDVRSTDTTFLQDLDRFFFSPARTETLAIIRILTGAMIAYVHCIWLVDISAFVGPNALIDNETWGTLHRGQVPDTKWTYLAATESMLWLRLHFILAGLAGILMSIGLCTRFACMVAWFLTLMTVHRMTGFLFGLDQVTVMLAMYLCLSKCGATYSIDVLIADRVSKGMRLYGIWSCLSGIATRQIPRVTACWTNTMATRLIQLHLCVIYVFGGIGKMRGDTWWDGTAMWYSVAAYEYQSLNVTWIGRYPWLESIATHVTVFWELWYCALVWPKWSRPMAIGIACIVHGGIAMFLGMITFGTIMIVANLAFVPPVFMHDVLQRLSARSGRSGSRTPTPFGTRS